MVIRKLLITSLLFISMNLYSQERKDLDLFECIKIASDSSLQAFVTENYYRSGYWEYRSYKAARLPYLSLSLIPLQYNRNIIKRYDFEENIDIYRAQQALFSSAALRLSQNLDLTGGTIFIDSELGYMRNFGETTYSQFNVIPFRIGYSQALYGFNRFKWERKIEPLKFEKVKKQFLYRQQEIAESTIQYFFNYMLAQKEYDLAVENALSADSLYAIGLERLRISTISEADVLTLRIDMINAKNMLKNTELSMKDARFAFVTFLNLDNNKNYSLVLPKSINSIFVPVEAALLHAQNNNPNYLGYEQEILEAKRDVDRVEKSIFDASISASIGFNQVAESFAEVYRRPLQQDIFTVNLTFPILDWGVRKGRINMAKSNLWVTQFSVQQTMQNLEQELVSAIENFNNQKDIISSAEEVLSLASEAYQINKRRFIIGKLDISALTLSLNRHKDAQRNYINSLKYYWTSYFKIRKITLYDFEKQESISILFDNKLNIL